MVLVEQIERRTLADRQALLSRGVTENLPTLGAEQDAFDAWLCEEPKPRAELSPAELEQLELRIALGVA